MAGTDGCGRTPEQVAALLARVDDDPDGHLRSCPACAETVRSLSAGPEMDPDLELRLLSDFRRWRDGAP